MVITSDAEYNVYVNGEKNGTVTQNGTAAATLSVTVTGDTVTHKHDMSVECEVSDNAVNFEHALTSENGKLYIDGAVLEPTVEKYSTYIDLPDGSYYLAEDVTLANYMEIHGDVNLCLNGHKLDMGENNIETTETSNGTERGNLKLCDCGEDGKITSSYSNISGSQTATIEAHYEFSMYGGTVENTAANTYSKSVLAFGGTVRLYGGEVVSHNDSAIMVDFNTGAGLHLSGEPIIQSLTYDKADIYLDNDYDEKIITLDAPLTITTPYRVKAEGENVFTSGWNTHMLGKAFSDYFVSVTEGRFIAKNENNELKIYDYAITEQPSAANSYTITANGAPDYAPQSYKWYSATVKTEDVSTDNAQTAELTFGGEGTSSYDSETGIWTGADSYHDGTVYFKISLNKGDVIKVKPSKVLGEYGYVKLEGSEGMFYAEEPNADGEYEITVEDDGEYTLSIYAGLEYDEPSPTVTAEIVKTVIGEAADGQAAAQFTGNADGTYVCKVTYADGTVLTSEVFDYAALKPPTTTPTVNPTATPTVNPTAAPTPTSNPNHNVVVDIKPGTPEITVDGLDGLIEETDPAASSITVKMTIESKAEDSENNEHTAIKLISGDNGNIDYFDISLIKTVDNEESAITETSKTLKVAIPFDMTGKKNIKVYRYHGGSAELLSDNAENNEYYVIGDGIITIYAKKFSTYAIGYNKENTEPTLMPTPTAKPKRRGGGSFVTATPTPAPEVTAEPTDNPAPVPEVKQHKAYIAGYEGKFSPDGNITRAETAAIFARLTDGFDENKIYTTSFADVDGTLWYSKYIGFAEKQNIIQGYQDETFKPEASITRAEFASMITRFAKSNTVNSDMPFTDINGHWASEQIAYCYAAGYIAGYDDNTFLPDNYITRAEAVAIINRMLDRNDIKEFDNPFSDVAENHWAYMDIMEAAVTHNAE